jgi:hypothetical protein
MLLLDDDRLEKKMEARTWDDMKPVKIEGDEVRIGK